MKHYILIAFAMATLTSAAQIDSVNTQSNLPDVRLISDGTTSYFVYLQDSVDGAKYNFELWERTITRRDDSLYLHWTRQSSDKEVFHHYSLKFDKNLKPASEKIHSQTLTKAELNVEKKCYLFKDNSLYSSSDTTLHNAPTIELEDLNWAFNWEADIELLSTLKWEEGTAYAICFYHPGSKTPPQYYTYSADRSETIPFNDTSSSCWVVKLVHSDQYSTEFWIDKKSNRVLLVKDSFMGRFRFKRSLI